MKTISKQDYYILLGLRELAKQNWDRLNSLEKSAAEILERGVEDGHSADFIHGHRDLDGVLKILDIKVKE